MPAPTTKDSSLVTVRVPRAVKVTIDSIAAREAETAAAVYRRIIRAGLALEHRRIPGDDDQAA